MEGCRRIIDDINMSAKETEVTVSRQRILPCPLSREDRTIYLFQVGKNGNGIMALSSDIWEEHTTTYNIIGNTVFQMPWALLSPQSLIHCPRCDVEHGCRVQLDFKGIAEGRANQQSSSSTVYLFHSAELVVND